MSNSATHTVTKLTALWALSESGLGGVMHAFKIPFTGFFLGGFAIIMITLLAFESPKPFMAILQATLLVMLVKAAASPHSPPMAYIAVGFQGFAGAVLFAVIPFFRLAACLFGMIALFESAIQRFLVTTLIFGKSVWEALDAFVAGILKELAVFHNFSISIWLVAAYTTVYVLWGLILGWWSSVLPKVLHEKSDSILLLYSKIDIDTLRVSEGLKRKSGYKWIALALILLFIISVFAWQGYTGKIGYVLGRTIAALLLFFFVINPFVKWIITQWLKTKQQDESNALSAVLQHIPELRTYIAPAMQMARTEHKGLAVYKAFVTNLIVLTLYK